MPHTARFLGHAAFQITTEKGAVIFIDPWLVDNPAAALKPEEVKKADLVLVTHDHFDHVGQAVDICKKTRATLVACPETSWHLRDDAGLPGELLVNGMGMNIGGTFIKGGISVTMFQAFHTSQTGTAVGYVIKLEDGTTVYHAGDTGIFGDMRLLADLYPVDLALLPTGGCFTMDSFQASKALTLLRPRRVIPMHYATFPILEKDAEAFVKAAKQEMPSVEVTVLKPGQQATFSKAVAKPAR